jgi:3-methyladenine DNA glycosylase AlkC
MPEPLKNMYTPELLGKLAAEIHKHYSKFDKQKFLDTVFDAEWPQRELKQRMRHITNSVHQYLPVSYTKQVEILSKAAPRFNGFIAMFFPDFVETFGLNDPDISIPALEEFTQYSSSEFAVRPFIIKYEKRMLKQHLQWSKHKNHHVRRLASEGIRPRLPWAMALPAFKKDPVPLLAILENLKEDESEYVRRSVANNLNDISKDNPTVVLGIIKRWKNLSKETDWIVKHASRGLLKKGHTEALQSFGLNHAVKSEVLNLKLSRTKLAIGESFDFSFTLGINEKKAHDLRVEYKIYFMKANGKQSAKVFQIGTYKLKPLQKTPFKRTHKFADLTTRKHHAGAHKLVVVVNGQEVAEKAFQLTL